MQIKDFESLEGIKNKLANKIFNSINTNYNKSSIVTIMAGSPCFHSGFGIKRIKKICEKIPNILDINLKDINNYTTLIKTIISIKGYDSKTATKFVNGLKKFKIFYKLLPKQNKIYEDFIKIISDKYKDSIFLFTGFRPSKNLEKLILENNGTIENTFKKNVTHLVVKDLSKKSQKIIKAKEKNINIVTIDYF